MLTCGFETNFFPGFFSYTYIYPTKLQLPFLSRLKLRWNAVFDDVRSVCLICVNFPINSFLFHSFFPSLGKIVTSFIYLTLSSYYFISIFLLYFHFSLLRRHLLRGRNSLHLTSVSFSRIIIIIWTCYFLAQFIRFINFFPCRLSRWFV